MSRSGSAARGAWAVQMFEEPVRVARDPKTGGSSALRWSVQGPGHVEQSQRGVFIVVATSPWRRACTRHACRSPAEPVSSHAYAAADAWTPAK